MKKIILFILITIIPVLSWCQELKLADDKLKGEMIEKISQATALMNTMQCDFEQTKYLSFLDDKMVSTGKMYYKQDSLLRWEYQNPYAYIFILNGTNVVMESAQKKDIVDIKNNRLFQEISKIMMNSVTGKNLTNNKDFKVSLFTQGDKWLAKLIPQKKEMKQMFSTITLYFDPAKHIVYKVELLEKTGDVSHIELKNIRLNVSIDEKVFDFK